MKVYVIIDSVSSSLLGVYSSAVDAFDEKEQMVKHGILHGDIFMLPLNSSVLDTEAESVPRHAINTITLQDVESDVDMN